MAGVVDARLAKLGLELPRPAEPRFNYIPFTTAGQLAFVAGQIPQWNGEVRHKGRIGEAGLGVEDGQAAAKLCALNLLAQVKVACGGDLDRVERVLRLGAFVSCTPDFVDTPKIANGASDLLVELLGEQVGRHARTTVGVASLPLGVTVELDAIVSIRA